jgi:DNA-binding MarR family transcriptional regulator
MSHFGSQMYEQVLTALRRINRAGDLHSHTLVQKQGVTTPQLVIMRELSRVTEMSAGELARRATLGQATVTGILDRLEARGWIVRSRCSRDKRRVLVRLTLTGSEVLDRAPAPMQRRFITAFERLPDWEQTQILASLQKVAALMETVDQESLHSVSIDGNRFENQMVSDNRDSGHIKRCTKTQEVSK